MPIKISKIKKEEDFKRIRQAGKYWTGSFVRLTIAHSLSKETRIAIVISKKVDNKAVVRNKIRRQIDAIMTETIDEINATSFDLIISVLPGKNETTFSELSWEIKKGVAALVRPYEKNSTPNDKGVSK